MWDISEDVNVTLRVCKVVRSLLLSIVIGFVDVLKWTVWAGLRVSTNKSERKS